jgi:hypothetical protein
MNILFINSFILLDHDFPYLLLLGFGDRFLDCFDFRYFGFWEYVIVGLTYIELDPIGGCVGIGLTM